MSLYNAGFTSVQGTWTFDDCELVTWEPAFDSASTHRELLTMNCRVGNISYTGRPQLAAWLTEAATNTTVMRNTAIEYLNGSGTPIRLMTYGSAFPVRYTFPVLDASSSATADDILELQADTLTVQ